jgi:hypothetical protein
MKLTILFITLLCTGLCTVSSTLFAQDKQVDFEIAHKYYWGISFEASGDNNFFLISPKLMFRHSFLKFDQNLKPMWKEPIIFTGDMKTVSYKNPADHSTIHYMIEDNNVTQILPNGTVNKLDTKIPKKEYKQTAAIFTDARGLNILTLTGDKIFPSGSLNWYTFSHDNLSQSKQKINLPLPSGIDEENESDWRLNEVTGSGLYFYYVSYKNDVKDKTRPVLSCHVIHVDMQGKPGKIIDLDPGVENYVVLYADYQQNVYPGLDVDQPSVFKQAVHPNSARASEPDWHPPTDNAFMGIKIDENTQKIYAVVALNDDLKVTKEGLPKNVIAVNAMELSIYDLQGKKLTRTRINNTPTKVEMKDRDYSSYSNKMEISALPDSGGVIIKYLRMGNGTFWAVNTQGEIVQEQKIKTYSITKSRLIVNSDLFSSRYYSLKDFKNAPYMAREKSSVYQFFEKLEDKDKDNSFYLSLKDYELFAVWDIKKLTMKLKSFTKK